MQRSAPAPTDATRPSSPSWQQRFNVLGVGIHALNLATTRLALTEAIAQRRKGYVCVTGVHGVTQARDDPAFRRILNEAFLCTPDGMPMVWMGKMAGHSEVDRVYGPDLMELILSASPEMGWSHFFYGGAPGVVEELQARFEARFPGLRITGTYTPPFRPLQSHEELELCRKVQEAKPDFFWVGLSTPKQETFMAEYLAKLDTTLMVGVGAAFDFHSGRVKQAPRWMQRSGLEWFYRLCQEPGRLGKRYLRNNPRFVLRAFGQLTGLRRYPLD